MARRRQPRGEGGRRVPCAAAAPGGRGPHAWYQYPDPVREATPNGTAQLRAARAGELALGPDVDESLREIGVMRGIGARASAKRVKRAVGRLDVELRYHGSLRAAAEAAAGDLPINDRSRPGRIVGAQLDPVVSAGPGAIAAARRVAVFTRAFNAMLEEWANVADDYGRDGAAAELHFVATERKLARRMGKKHKFTGMKVDMELQQHHRNEAKMLIGRQAIMSSVRPVEYHAFRARLPDDDEEIDSPKAAWNADECEVRVPDGALVNPGGISFVIRANRTGARTGWHVERLRGLGLDVDIDKGL